MSTTSPFGRLLTAMVSPMRPDGSIDPEGTRRLAEHLVETGHDGIVVNGTTGESATLSDDESIEMVRLVADAVGDRVKVVAGVGSNATAHSVEMTRRAIDAGATGLLLVSPYYNKPTQAGLIQHVRAVAEVSDLPVMLYDIPGRTAIPFDTATLLELAQLPTVKAVKDAKGDAWATSHLLADTDLLYFSGDDATTLPWLALGAVGTVSVVGHVAGREYAAMLAAVDAGDLAGAREIHTRLIPAVDAIMKPSQGAIMAKAALVETGVLENATVRLPLVESPPEHLEALRAGLKESGLL
jgi:4-hydroxy-tetrahydrodipicolinate synthase